MVARTQIQSERKVKAAVAPFTVIIDSREQLPYAFEGITAAGKMTIGRERFERELRQADNALSWLVGDGLVQVESELSSTPLVQEIAAGMPSDLLAQRPDIRAAEYQLRSRNASIGAARAALFPRITLTGSVGTASGELSRLFEGATGTWLFAPQFSMPIFDTRLWAALRVSKTDREIALTQYERTVQTAFREVADALAVRGTIDEQLAAQESLTATTADTYRLAEKRYSRGLDNYLGVLDAQRSHFNAQQALVSLRFAKLASQIQLFSVLGGGAD